MMGPLVRLVVALCLTSLVVVRPAGADEQTTRAAKRHYDRGQQLFALQKFEDALEQFQQAFDAEPIPDFLFNIGQCHRNLGEYDAAIFSFKRFLKLDPAAPNREQVEALIVELEDKRTTDDTHRFGLRRARSSTPRDQRAPLYRRWWFWTGVAVIGVAGGVGIYSVVNKAGPPDTALGNFGFEK